MNVVIVGHDRTITTTLASIVEHLGCQIAGVLGTSLEGIDFVAGISVDLALVDIDTPYEYSGSKSAMKLRHSFGIPSILIASHTESRLIKASLPAKPLGLLIKPVRNQHVELCIGAARQFLQTTNQQLVQQHKSSIIQLGSNTHFDYESRCLYINGTPLDLTSSELKLFELCLQRQGNIVPYETVIEHVWKGRIVAESTRRGLYHRLRKKLDDRLFETVNGLGCRIRVEENQQ